MTLEDRIPLMSKQELENLQDNALRLAKNGAPKQQAEAERLLPIIAEAIAAQRKAQSAEAAEKKVARQKDLAAARAKRAASRKAEADRASD